MGKESLYRAWLEAVQEHSFSKAEKLYHQIIELYPHCKEVNFPMGVWYKEKGLNEKALDALRRALITDPEIAAEIYYYLGNVSRNMGNLLEAIDYFEQSIKEDPNFFEAHYNLGKIYSMLKNSEKALKEYKKALNLNPGDVDTYVNIGVEFSNLGKSKEAIKMYEKALEFEPQSYLIYSNLGVEYTALGEYEKAIEFHKKALTLNTFYGDAWYNLACTYALANDVENSLKALERAIKLDEDNIEYAKKDPELDNVKHTEEYKRLI
ncbi:MAG: hypothetical protein PWQ67_1568 [Clostridia bacterium]|nr:hypothetical protein [Clostridia bacterium]MDN5323114.1 hypothetical protein [Clostridia bacterium]